MKYPFSPDILDAIPEELAELFRGLELQLLEEIARRLKAAGQLNEVTVQDIRALRSHGISLEEIKKAISKATGISRKTLDSLLDDVVERNQKYYRELIDIAKVTEPETLVKKKDIDAIIKQTKDELANITRTIGFVVNNGRTQIKPTQAYKWALDNAAMQIQSGAISYGQAIANATRELADSGLTVINYESGHRDQVDVAVRRAVMTGVNQLNSQYADESLDYLETEYVEVSAHSGARDKDGPLGWENHKKWQGKVYWWKEKSKGNPEYQYPEFEKTCGYGSVTGILGANCRHNYTPFIPDVMERTYTDEELANIDPPDFEYEGKKYTHYEATQKQREIERTIRKWKRREAAATNPEDKQAAQIRIRRLQQKYKEFSKAANLRTQPERMKAYVPQKKVVDNPAGQDIIKTATGANGATGSRQAREKRERIEGMAAAGPKPTENPDVVVWMRKINWDHSREQDVKAVNPNWSTGAFEWKNNCQRCVTAYEARRRGFDVTAKPCYSVTDKYASNFGFALPYNRGERKISTLWHEAGVSFGNVKNFTKADCKAAIEGCMAQYGNGSRAIIHGYWEHNQQGHVFIAENVGGKVQFFDPQSGSMDCSSHLDMMNPRSMYILRIDDLPFNSEIVGVVENVG